MQCICCNLNFIIFTPHIKDRALFLVTWLPLPQKQPIRYREGRFAGNFLVSFLDFEKDTYPRKGYLLVKKVSNAILVKQQTTGPCHQKYKFKPRLPSISGITIHQHGASYSTYQTVDHVTPSKVCS